MIVSESVDFLQLKGSEAMAAIGLKHPPTFLANYLTPAIETGFAFLCHDSEKPEQVRLFSRCSIGSQPGIPGGSTLIFDIELLAIN